MEKKACEETEAQLEEAVEDDVEVEEEQEQDVEENEQAEEEEYICRLGSGRGVDVSREMI